MDYEPKIFCWMSQKFSLITERTLGWTKYVLYNKHWQEVGLESSYWECFIIFFKLRIYLYYFRKVPYWLWSHSISFICAVTQRQWITKRAVKNFHKKLYLNNNSPVYFQIQIFLFLTLKISMKIFYKNFLASEFQILN